ncbi:NmrA family NAD(P)-binding protein, partial [Nguyenibacter vanlangensis]
MKIFVTGASGYIGGSVAAVLAGRGHEVRGLVRAPAKADAVRAHGI